MDTILYRTDEGDGFRRGSAANLYGRERWCRPDRPAAPRCGAAARGTASRGGAAESLGRRDGSTTSQGARGGGEGERMGPRLRRPVGPRP